MIFVNTLAADNLFPGVARQSDQIIFLEMNTTRWGLELVTDIQIQIHENFKYSFEHPDVSCWKLALSENVEKLNRLEGAFKYI